MTSPQHSAPVRHQQLEMESTWALIATLVAAIFIFIPSTSIPFIATKTFLLALGAFITLALYILARLTRGNIIFPPAVLLGALWLPTIAYALSAVFSGVPFASALWGSSLDSDTLGFMLTVAFLGTLAALVLRRKEHYRSFLRAGGWVFCGVTVLAAIVVIAGQFAPRIISPAFSIIGSLDDLSFFLGLGIIGVLLTFRFVELSRYVRYAFIASVGIALVLIAVVNSSLVWALLALFSLGLFIEGKMQRWSKTGNPDNIDTDVNEIAGVREASFETDKGSHSVVLPILVLVVSLFSLVSGTLGGALATALHINTLSINPSWQSTLSIAHDAYSTAPVFGTGPDSFGVEWLKYRDAALNSTIFWNVEFSSGVGFIPTSFITTGLVGAFAWIAFLTLFVVLGLRMLILRTPRDGFIRYVSVLSFIATLYLFALAIFGLPNTLLLALAFVFSGIFASTMRFSGKSGQWGVVFSKSPRLGFIVVFVLAILLLASVVVAYALVEHYVAIVELTRADAAFSVGDLNGADQAVQSSIYFVPSTEAYQVEANIALARLNQITASSTMPTAAAQSAFQTALSTGIGAALTATRLNPSDYQSWLALGSLYAQAVPLKVPGAYTSAKSAYERAETLNPTNPQIPYTLAQLDIAHGDTKAAENELTAAITLKQDYTTAIFLLSQLEVQDGNVKGALAAALAAAYFAPNNSNILFQVGILRAAEGDFTGAEQALLSAIAVNPHFANARYFLAAIYAKQGNIPNALTQMQAIAALSSGNATAVASQLTALKAGKDPFAANFLSMSSAPVKQ